MKIASFNVNSVRVRLPNLLDWLAKSQVDVVCLQEIKAQDDTFPAMDIKAAGYDSVIVGQKSYNGVAVLSKHPITVIQNTIGDEQARYLEVEIAGKRIINIYAPNGNPIDTEKFPYKLDWLKRLRARMITLLNEEVPFLVTGDYNIIPEPMDAAHPQAWVSDALFQPESRAMYRNFLSLGLTDAFRIFHKEGGHYTFWDYQAGSWQRDNGIRIDHFLLSPQLADKCIACDIDRDERGKDKASDHTPIICTIRD